MPTFPESELLNLISKIEGADFEMCTTAELPPGIRRELTVELEICIVDPAHLEMYSVALQKSCARARLEEGSEPLSNEDTHRVLVHGLAVLTDDQLIQLAFNTRALKGLSDYIYDKPHAWDDSPWGQLVSEAAVADMRRRGLDPDAVMAKAKDKCLAKTVH